MKMVTRLPCIFNASSIVGTTLATGAVYFHWVEGVLGTMTLIFSAGSAVFTCLIAFRRWYRGFKLEQHLKKKKS